MITSSIHHVAFIVSMATSKIKFVMALVIARTCDDLQIARNSDRHVATTQCQRNYFGSAGRAVTERANVRGIKPPEWTRYPIVVCMSH